MNDPERPEFPAHFEAQLETAQVHVDQFYWAQLRGLLVPVAPVQGERPPEAKRPSRLRMVIEAYSRRCAALPPRHGCGATRPTSPASHVET